MFAVSFIVALFGVATVRGYTAATYPKPYSNWGESCIKVSQLYPLNERGTISSAWKSVDKSVTKITGYYKNMGGYYKKVNDINCVDIKDMIPMYFMKSGSKYYLDQTRSSSVSSAMYSNCYQTVETFPKAVCDAPGNGPEPNRPMRLSISSAAGKCDTMWATTEYSDAVILDTPSDWTSPADDWDLDKIWTDGDDVVDDNFGDDDFEQQPYLKSPIFGDFEEQPQLEAPIFDEPAPIVGQPEPASNTFTVTIGKWSLLIIALVMANFAVIMTILYCREKNKVNTEFVEKY